jgi:hypothetical protein
MGITTSEVHMNISRLQARRRAGHSIVLGLSALVLASSTSAQYALDWEEEAHDGRERGIRYFGSAKDEKGVLIPNVTFLLESKDASFVFVSDAEGRFRGHLPKDIPPNSVTPKCSKPGLEFVRVSKRLGPRAAEATVQVDCVLRRKTAAKTAAR